MQSTELPATNKPAISRRGISPWPFVALFAILLCIGFAYWLRLGSGGSDFQYYGQWIGKDAADFKLTGQNGAPFQLSSQRGKLVLMTFGFTHCPNICPTTLANLSAIVKALPAADQQRVRVLFVSVDPARDTPAALKEYVHFYSPDFIGATGSSDDIAKVAKAYGAYYEAVMQQSQVASNYYTVNHSAYIYLISPSGQFAVLYDNDKLADHARVLQDIQHLLAVSS